MKVKAYLKQDKMKTEDLIQLGVNRGKKSPVLVTTRSLLKYIVEEEAINKGINKGSHIPVTPLLNPHKIRPLLKSGYRYIMTEDIKHATIKPFKYTVLEKRLLAPNEITQLKARVISRRHEVRRILHNLLNITLEGYTLFEVVRNRISNDNIDWPTKTLIQITPASDWVNYTRKNCGEYILSINTYSKQTNRNCVVWATKRDHQSICIDGVPLFKQKINSEALLSVF